MDPTDSDSAYDPIRRILENETKLNGTLYPTAEFRTLYVTITMYVRKASDSVECNDSALVCYQGCRRIIMSRSIAVRPC